jgi:hypothetical protein
MKFAAFNVTAYFVERYLKKKRDLSGRERTGLRLAMFAEC